MKISLLDPGLRQRDGHYYDWVHQLTLEARRRNISVVIGCAQHAASDLQAALRPLAEVRPLFTVSPHHAPPRLSFAPGHPQVLAREEAARHSHESVRLAAELSTLPPSDLWVFPTLFASQAAAYALVPNAPPVVGCIHNAPELDGAAAATSWQQALHALYALRVPDSVPQPQGAPANSVRLGTTTAPLQQAYAALSPLPIQLWPLAHDGLRAIQPRNQVTTVGILGHQRPEKGLGILPPLITGLLALGLKVLLHDASGQLRAPALPGLQLVSGFVSDFPALVSLCDLIVVPNQAANYRLRGSGPVWEAMACGVPVLAPRDCYPGELVLSSGVGLCFDTSTPEAILRTLQTALQRYPQLAAAAFACSEQWPKHHGVGRFLDQALSGLAID